MGYAVGAVEYVECWYWHLSFDLVPLHMETPSYAHQGVGSDDNIILHRGT